MGWIIDASVAIQWFLVEDDSESARRLIEAGQSLIAPDTIFRDTHELLLRRIRAGACSREKAKAAAGALPLVLSLVIPLVDVLDAALDLALDLDASGIRFHGSSNDGSIGTAASHGCMRMHMWDIEALYPLVPVGTPVYIRP